MSDQMFVIRNKNVFMASDRGDEIPEIPVGYYTLCEHPMAGLYLQRVDDFDLPKKMYGNTIARADKITSTFLDRPGRTTGALLSGNKGAGKSLLSRAICVNAVAKGLPVIILEQPFAGPGFDNFMNSIKQPVVVFIDEFEKKYDEPEKQNALLSLLDGTGQGHKMYLMTSNSADVSTFLLNRPSRIFYHMQYKKLDEEVMLGYCADHLQNPDHLKKIQTLWALSTDMSFDILQSLVEELNRYPNVDFLSLLDDMNISMSGQMMKRFTLKEVTVDGERVRINEGQNAHVHLVYFQDGDSQVATTVYLPLEMQMKLKAGMKPDEFYFYNHEEEEAFKKTGKYDRDCATEEFPIKMRYEEGNTIMTSERLVFHREWNGVKVMARLEINKEEPGMTAFAKLFADA